MQVPDIYTHRGGAKWRRIPAKNAFTVQIADSALTNPRRLDILVLDIKAVKGSSTQPADAQRGTGWCKVL